MKKLLFLGIMMILLSAGAAAQGKEAGENAILREAMTLSVQGREITAELHEIGGGEYEREYRLCFLENGREISAATFTGDEYAHLRHFESDDGSPVLRATDVNMDGFTDVSVIRYTGVTETEAAHFLYHAQSGGYERYEELDTLSWWRCVQYPMSKLMLNHQREDAKNGVWTLYRWEGMKLTTLATGIISDVGTDGMKARVFRNNEKVYEVTWTGLGDDGGEQQRQTEAMIAVMLDGAQPGEGVPLNGSGETEDNRGGSNG